MPRWHVWSPFAKNALLLWMLVHLIAAMFSFLGGRRALAPSVSISSWVVIVTLALVMVDMARRHERILLENLGVSMPQVVGILAGIVFVAEALLRFLMAVR